MTVRSAIAALALTTALGAFASAAPAASPPPAEPPPATPAPAPVYQADLVRLSEILGTLAYLDPLCNGGRADRWRDRMARLIDAQQLGLQARRPYVEAFNRGLRSLAVAHRGCDPRTRLILDRFFAEGAAIADRLEFRFGTSADGTAGSRGLTRN